MGASDALHSQRRVWSLSLVWVIARVIYRISLPDKGTVPLYHLSLSVKLSILLLLLSCSLLCHERFVLTLHLDIHWKVFHNYFTLMRHVLIIYWFLVTNRLLWILDWSLVQWLSPNMTTFIIYISLMAEMLLLRIHLSCFMWLIYLTTIMLLYDWCWRLTELILLLWMRRGNICPGLGT